MDWVTVIWSLTAGICLTLAGVHLLVWVESRKAWVNLLFAIAAAAAAGCTWFEQALMHAQTPGQFGELLRWMHVPLLLIVVSLVWFVRLYLQAGRVWLAWLICGLRVVTLVLTFSLHPNLNFREITGLRQFPFLGETVVTAIGVKNPWTNITHVSAILFILFVLDAARAAWRQGNRRRAAVVGSTFACGIAVAVVLSELLNRGILPVPFTVSIVFLIIVLGMAYELSADLVGARQLSRELRQTQERMRQAVRAADLGLWEWDVVRDEMWATEEGRERAGVGESGRIGFDRFVRSVHPDDREATRLTVRRALETGDELEMEYRSVTLAGETRSIVVRGRVERSRDGKPLRVRGVSMDVTERRKADAEARLQHEELAHVQRASTVGHLASAIAHELNQPLGAILRNAEAAELFLRKRPPDCEEVQAILADIKSDDQRAGAVIDRMRSLLKRHMPEYGSLDLKELVDHVSRLVRPEAQTRRVRLAAQLPTDIPLVRGDRVHLQQVFLNLLVNGMDAMGDTPFEKRRLVVRARRANDQTVEVAVRDHGHGIPAEKLARIFEPFFTTKSNGLGMGLPISHTIIASHGGRIWAENNQDSGATFRFTLKVADGEGQVSGNEERGAK